MSLLRALSLNLKGDKMKINIDLDQNLVDKITSLILSTHQVATQIHLNALINEYVCNHQSDFVRQICNELKKAL